MMDNATKKVSKYFFYLISVCYATDGIVEVLVGSVWPTIAKSIGVDISFIGILVMVNFFGSMLMSTNTYKVRQKLGTNYTMILSMLCFIMALILYSFARSIFVFAAGMFINGIGIGLIEINASSYVLKAYDAKEETLLGAFWAIGSVIGSTVMALAIRYNPPYQRGFMIVIAILVINIIFLLFAKASWTKQKQSLSKEIVDRHSVSDEEKKVDVKISHLIKHKKVLLILVCFFLLEGVSLTYGTLISTIATLQGNASEVLAVEMVIFYYIAIFVGRIVFGHLIEKFGVINILKINILAEAILFVLLYLNVFDSKMVCIIIVAMGLVTSPLVPLLYSYVKETFDVLYLSALIGYGDVCGLLGIIFLSGISTFVMKTLSINYVELGFAILTIVLLLVFLKIESKKK